MVSKETFFNIFRSWNSKIFTDKFLTLLWGNLAPGHKQRYVAADLCKEVTQCEIEFLRQELTGLLAAYRFGEALPSIIILDLETGEVYRDPTQWGPLLDR